jgi:hypothetical protein
VEWVALSWTKKLRLSIYGVVTDTAAHRSRLPTAARLLVKLLRCKRREYSRGKSVTMDHVDHFASIPASFCFTNNMGVIM